MRDKETDRDTWGKEERESAKETDRDMGERRERVPKRQIETWGKEEREYQRDR